MEDLIKACRKIEKSLDKGGFGHAIWCNFQLQSCKKCNCGIADMITALKALQQSVEANRDPCVVCLDWSNKDRKRNFCQNCGRPLN